MDYAKKLPKKFIFFQDSPDKPCPEFVPGQSYELSELVHRFERGQRLGVHLNFNPESELIGEDESFEQAPSENIVDIVDVQREYETHEQAKKELAKRKKKAPTPPNKEAKKDDAEKKEDE